MLRPGRPNEYLTKGTYASCRLQNLLRDPGPRAGRTLRTSSGEGEVGRKKDYDPRTYLGLAEVGMAARVKQAVTDLRGNGKTLFK